MGGTAQKAFLLSATIDYLLFHNRIMGSRQVISVTPEFFLQINRTLHRAKKTEIMHRYIYSYSYVAIVSSNAPIFQPTTLTPTCSTQLKRNWFGNEPIRRRSVDFYNQTSDAAESCCSRWCGVCFREGRWTKAVISSLISYLKKW